MDLKKGEVFFAEAFLNQNFDRIIDWAVGDIRKCCRMKQDGTCEENGALVGAFILWCCAIEYFGGLYSGLTTPGATKARFKAFIEKYMEKYDPKKIEDLRWSLTHYYSPQHYVLYHENNFKSNEALHLSTNNRGIMLHLGWAINDLEKGVKEYHNDLKNNDQLKVKAWRFFKEQHPIMPISLDMLTVQDTINTTVMDLQLTTITASGTVSEEELR